MYLVDICISLENAGAFRVIFFCCFNDLLKQLQLFFRLPRKLWWGSEKWCAFLGLKYYFWTMHSSIPNAWPNGSPLAWAPSLQSLKYLKKNQNLRRQLNHKISCFPSRDLNRLAPFLFFLLLTLFFFLGTLILGKIT